MLLMPKDDECDGKYYNDNPCCPYCFVCLCHRVFNKILDGYLPVS